MKLTFHPQAKAEFVHSVQFYENQSSGLGSRFMVAVLRQLSQIRRFPYSGSKVENNIRTKILTDFPYDIVYEILSKKIFIIAIKHQKQKPGYWKDRQEF